MFGCVVGPYRLDCVAPCCCASWLAAAEAPPAWDRTGADTGAAMVACGGMRIACCSPLLDSCYPAARTQIDCCAAQCCGMYLGCLGDPLRCCRPTTSKGSVVENGSARPAECRLADCSCCGESLWARCWFSQLFCCPCEPSDDSKDRHSKEPHLCGCHCLSSRCSCLPACSACCAAARTSAQATDGSSIKED